MSQDLNDKTHSNNALFYNQRDNVDVVEIEGSYGRLPPRFIQSKEKTDKFEGFAVNFLNELFKVAMQEKVSDVHFESLEQGNICRIRKDNSLHLYGNILTDLQMSAIREKIYARAMIEESFAKGHAVDANGWLRYDHRLDLRISSIPTTHGYSIVIRLLDQSNSGRSIDTIDMSPSVRSAILENIQSAHGLILITGPTGSGKTSTLYSFLNELNGIDKKIITIENPPEYTVRNVQHVSVSNNISFNQALRAALRQDPDIILVGEIRDSETAKTAIEAAQTGHLVLSTLHTNSSVGALSRLMELGVDASHINETLIAVSAQRLVRKCKDVRNVEEATPEQKEWLRKSGFPDKANSFFGRGFSNEYYEGRIPVIEYLVMNDEIREQLSLGNVKGIYDLAEQQKQYETLDACVVRLAEEGKTSLEEAMSLSSSKSSASMEGMVLSECLIALGYITSYQLEYVQELLRSTPLIQRRSLSDTLVEMHFCSLEQIRECGDVPDA